MVGSEPALQTFLRELRRRHVIRVVVAYAVVAWLIIEVAATVFPSLALPDWTVTLVVALVALGFPAAVVLAWAFELTPEGPVRTASAPKPDVRTEAVEDPTALEPKVVAVLPFENIGGDAGKEFFADGITEEIIAQLTRIRELRVISRTSVMQYKHTQKSLPIVAGELGAGSILEGSVRHAGGRVRITAQLIDARDDSHRWAETYDREIADIFAIQGDVALSVASALEASLAPGERELIEARPTGNLQAYQYFLRAKDYQTRTHDPHNLDLAVEMYERAIELDPSFALALARLSITHALIWWYHYDRDQARLTRARELAEAALRLAPDLAEAHLALAEYHYRGFLDYDRALEEYAIAAEQEPNNAMLVLGRASVRRRQGRMDLALEDFQASASLDPRSPVQAFNVGETSMLVRDYVQAAEWLERAIALGPDWSRPYAWLAHVHLLVDGDIEAARQTLARAPDPMTTEQTRANMQVWVELLAGDFDRALELAVSPVAREMDNQFRYWPRELLEARIRDFRGDAQGARAAYATAEEDLARRVAVHPGDPRFHAALGIALAGGGHASRGIAEGERAVHLLPLAREALRGTHLEEDLAHILVLAGEYDAAIDRLGHLLRVPSDLSPEWLRLDPVWLPLRGLERFEALLDRAE
jgi:TolB-like protein/Flp pilus assembly protein TadD